MKQGVGEKFHRGIEIVAVGVLTGAFVGVIVTLYNALIELSEEFSRGYYTYFARHPAMIPLLFAALLLGAIVVGGFVRFLPIIRGSGFPQTEGAAQGLLRFKWYKVLTGMFAASLLCVFMGLSAGSEGPSLMIGGACGDGLSSVTRRNPVVRRYQITGGACAGLAVALNAPLTGIVFAYEETHKRFTPEVFACSFTSVVVAMIIRSALAPALGLFNRPIFSGFVMKETSIGFLPYTMLAAVMVSLLGIAFYFAALFARKLFRKIRIKRGKWALQMAIPFLLAGAAGLITTNVMGGGLHFIEGLRGGSEELERIFSSPLWATLLAAVILRFAVTIANIGAEVPCCSSLPMFAIGAGAGALLSLLFVKIGMDSALTDTVIVVCLATFFATVVKAPFTSIIMTVELTGEFTFLLPVVLSVAISYFVSSMFHTEPMYEKFLEEMLEEQGKKERVTVRVRVGAAAAGKRIRDVLWPSSAYVTQILREGNAIPSVGSAELMYGDILTVEGAPREKEEYFATLREAAGEILQSFPAGEPNAEEAPDGTTLQPPGEGE